MARSKTKGAIHGIKEKLKESNFKHQRRHEKSQKESQKRRQNKNNKESKDEQVKVSRTSKQGKHGQENEDNRSQTTAGQRSKEGFLFPQKSAFKALKELCSKKIRKRVKEPRKTAKLLNIKRSQIRATKQKITDFLRLAFRFKFKFAFTKYTKISQMTIIHNVHTAFEEEYGWTHDNLRIVLRDMAEDKRKSYINKKKGKGIYYGALQKRLVAARGSVSIFRAVPLEDNEVADWSDSSVPDSPPTSTKGKKVKKNKKRSNPSTLAEKTSSSDKRRKSGSRQQKDGADVKALEPEESDDARPHSRPTKGKKRTASHSRNLDAATLAAMFLSGSTDVKMTSQAKRKQSPGSTPPTKRIKQTPLRAKKPVQRTISIDGQQIVVYDNPGSIHLADDEESAQSGESDEDFDNMAPASAQRPSVSFALNESDAEESNDDAEPDETDDESPQRVSSSNHQLPKHLQSVSKSQEFSDDESENHESESENGVDSVNSNSESEVERESADSNSGSGTDSDSESGSGSDNDDSEQDEKEDAKIQKFYNQHIRDIDAEDSDNADSDNTSVTLPNHRLSSSTGTAEVIHLFPRPDTSRVSAKAKNTTRRSRARASPDRQATAVPTGGNRRRQGGTLKSLEAFPTSAISVSSIEPTRTAGGRITRATQKVTDKLIREKQHEKKNTMIQERKQQNKLNRATIEGLYGEHSLLSQSQKSRVDASQRTIKSDPIPDNLPYRAAAGNNPSRLFSESWIMQSLKRG